MTWHKCPGGGGQVQDRMDLNPPAKGWQTSKRETKRLDGAFFSFGPPILENFVYDYDGKGSVKSNVTLSICIFYIYTAAAAAGSSSMRRPGCTNPRWSQRWQTQHAAQAAEKKQWSMQTENVGRRQFRMQSLAAQGESNAVFRSLQQTWKLRNNLTKPWRSRFLAA